LLSPTIRYEIALIKKTRASGSSIVVTIPSQLVDAYNINSGDIIEIIPIKNGEIRIKKIATEHPYEDKELNKKILKKTA